MRPLDSADIIMISFLYVTFLTFGYVFVCAVANAEPHHFNTWWKRLGLLVLPLIWPISVSALLFLLVVSLIAFAVEYVIKGKE